MADNESASPSPSIDLFPPSYEPIPENPTPAKDSAFEKIRKAGAGIFEKHGVLFKRGGGRPRKDGSPNKLDVPINAPATALPANAAPIPAADTPTFDSALVRRCISAVVKGVSGFLDKKLFRAAKKANYSPTEAQQLIADNAITKEELDGFAELSEICLRKYGVGTQYAPEIGLAAIVLGVGVRYTVALRSLAPDPEQEKVDGAQ